MELNRNAPTDSTHVSGDRMSERSGNAERSDAGHSSKHPSMNATYQVPMLWSRQFGDAAYERGGS